MAGEYDYGSGQNIKGYVASTNLRIKVRKVDTANQVIDSATTNGANQVNGFTFDVEDKAKAQNEARERMASNKNLLKLRITLIRYSKGFFTIICSSPFTGDLIVGNLERSGRTVLGTKTPSAISICTHSTRCSTRRIFFSISAKFFSRMAGITSTILAFRC